MVLDRLENKIFRSVTICKHFPILASYRMPCEKGVIINEHIATHAHLNFKYQSTLYSSTLILMLLQQHEVVLS